MIWGTLFWLLAACVATLAYGHWQRGNRLFVVLSVAAALVHAVYGSLFLAGVVV